MVFPASTSRHAPAEHCDLPTAEKSKRSPAGILVVSPTSSSDSPSTVGQLSPTRRMLFERTTPHHASVTQRTADTDQTGESRQEAEIQELRSCNQRKEYQLRVLHQRFHNIQQGLGSIDEERTALVEKSKKLEKEKRHIQKQLELREREILALVKRCASQEEKMRESSRLRAENRELSFALKSVQSRLSNTDQEREDLASLRRKLQESELAREELQERLRKVQREHDSIADTLQECLASIRQLTEEKQEIEEERRRERKRAEIEMEKQRLEHFQAANDLKSDLESKQLRIDQMEKILQENMYSKNSLRRENAITQEESRTTIARYEQRVGELQDQLDRKIVSESKEGHEKTLSLLQKKIEEKDAIMMGLENEFSGQMGMLMKAQSSLDEAEEEKKVLEEKVQRLQKLESEHSAFTEYLRILESNLAELTTENAHLTVDKESLLEDIEHLQEKIEELGGQITQHHQHRRAREKDLHDLLEAEKEEIRGELEASLAQARKDVDLLKSDLSSRNRWISKIEEELTMSRKEILRSREQVQLLQHQQDQSHAPLQSSLDKANAEVARLREELEKRSEELEGKLDKDIFSLEELQHDLQMEKDLNSLLRIELDEANESISANERRVENLEHALKESEAKRLDLQRQVDDSSDKVSGLEAKTLHLKAFSDSLNNELKTALQNLSVKEVIAKNAELQSQKKGEEICRLVLELDSSRKSKSEDEQALSTYKKRISLLEETLASHDENRVSTEETITKLTTDLSLALAGKRHMEEKCKTLKNELGRVREKEVNESQGLQARYENASKLLAEKEALIISLESSLRSEQENLGSCQNQVINARATIVALEEKIKEKDHRIGQLEKQVGGLKNDLASSSIESKQKCSSLDSQIQLAHAKIGSLTNDLDAKNTEAKDLKQKMVEYEMRHKAKEHETLEVSDKVSVLEERLQRLNAQLECKDAMVQELHTKVAIVEEETAEEKSKVKELESALKCVESSFSMKMAKAEEVKTSLENKLIDESTQHSMTMEALRMAEAKLQTSEVLYADEKISLQAKITSLEASLEESRQTADQAKRSLENRLAEENKRNFTTSEALRTVENQLRELENQHADQKQVYEDKLKSLEGIVVDSSETVEQVKRNLQEKLTEECNRHSAMTEALRVAEAKLLESEGRNIKQQRIFDERIQVLESLLEKSRETEETVRSSLHDKLTEECDRHCKTIEALRVAEAKLVESENHEAEYKKHYAEQKEMFEETVNLLETSLAESKKSSDKARSILEEKLKEERDQHSRTSNELRAAEARLIETENLASALEEHMAEHKKQRDMEAMEFHGRIKSVEVESQENEAGLKAEISRLVTEVALKNDEIRELRVIELGDKDEKIKKLSEALEKIKVDAQTNEVEITGLINDLKRENKHLKEQIDDLDFEATVAKERHDHQVVELQKAMRDLLSGKSKTEAMLVEQDCSISELRKQEQTLRETCEQLKQEVEMTKSALDISILRAKEVLETQRTELERKSGKEITELKTKLLKLEKESKSTERMLKDRSGLLGEMVDHNRELESKLDKHVVKVAALQEENSRYHKELGESKSELAKKKEESYERENSLSAKLSEERTLREKAEQALTKLKVEHKDATKARKRATVLEKENESLKHKVSRQEAYLQRKLQKEKIHRGRSTPSNGRGQSPDSKLSAFNSNSSIVLQTPPSKLARPSPRHAISNNHSSDIGANSDQHSQRSARSMATIATTGSGLKLPKAHSGIPFLFKSRSSESQEVRKAKHSDEFAPIESSQSWD